jgi:predicted ATPase
VLRLRAEQEFAVPALALPAATRLPTLAAYVQSEAVALFLARAQAAQPAFQLTPGNAPTIAELCTRLDGLPLALELAAPRLKLLSPQALLSRLEGRLQVLSVGARDLPERQRTMQATITWSYELLSPAEQALFRRLAVFVGGWRLSAAEQVCPEAGALDLDVLEGLASLLDKSLLLQEQAETGETRFRLMHVLREFGLERLEGAGEMALMREAHAAYYMTLAEEAEPQVLNALPQGSVGQLAAEHENLRAALTWWLERAEQIGDQEAAERALRLCGALSGFWAGWLYYREGLAFQERALAVRAGVSTAVQLKVLLKAAHLHQLADELERGEALAQEALVLARQVGDLPQTAEALLLVGFAAFARDQFAAAQASMEEAAALYQQEGDARGRAGSLMYMITTVLPYLGEFERAVVYGEEALATFRALGDQGGVGFTLSVLGSRLFLTLLDQERGAAMVEQGLALLREVKAVWGTSWSLFHLGTIRCYQGQFDEARRLMEEGVALARGQAGWMDRFSMNSDLALVLVLQGKLSEARALYEEHQALLPTSSGRRLLAGYLDGRAALEAAMGTPATAAHLWGAAEALREALGAPLYPVDRAVFAPRIAAARTQLGEVAFADAWADGRNMTPEQALDGVD